MNCIVIWIAGVCALLNTGCIAQFLIVPRNTAVLQGNVAVMKCKANDTTQKLLWRIFNESSSEMKTIYTGNKDRSNYTQFFEVKNKDEQFELTVKVSMATPKYYACEIPGRESSGAYLIAIESEPQCQHFSNGVLLREDQYSSLELTCFVRFAGIWAPTMRWEIITETGETREYLDTNNTRSQNTVISTAFIAANLSLNGCIFKCITEFNQLQIGDLHLKKNIAFHLKGNTATNIPEYSFTWTSPVLTVSSEFNGFYITLKTDSSRMSGTIIAVVFMMFIVLGITVLIFLLLRRSKTGWIPKFSKFLHKQKFETSVEIKRDAVENEGERSDQGQSTTDSVSLPASLIPDVVEETGQSTSVKKLSKHDYVEMKGHLRETETGQFARGLNSSCSTTRKSSYVKMYPVRQSSEFSSPPKPPRASQVRSQTQSPLTPPPKPPRASQAETTVYVDLEFTKSSDTPVAQQPRIPMFGLVEVYASIDHNATAPPPPTS